MGSEVFANDTSRRSRSEFYLSYCIPSSCEHEDLESSIQEITKKINSFSDFRVTVSVDRLNCQVKNDLTLTTADIIFM
ncbi:hypothetical protein BDFB_004985 [Asbolus verrucosus]|uniref:Uncharacterized protein n=1 Tax=Asbolus verrucosus TaxID=1661398 RepID=A0A482V9P5_ASBVE|nr:hypothetical protein BDFB_004985 [Asbolus verrucosus]